MATMEQVHEFVTNYYDVKGDMATCERKSFVRFRKAMPLDMDETAIEHAYRAFTGNTPTYNKMAASMEPWRAEDYKSKANRIVDALTHDPTSFTDLYNAVMNVGRYCKLTGAPSEPTGSLRKCFKTMADAGIIGCMEIKTCGKCHIRLYYLND